jgi:hypothetical protein
MRCESGAIRAEAPELCQAGASGNSAESTLELGHHKAPRGHRAPGVSRSLPARRADAGTALDGSLDQ